MWPSFARIHSCACLALHSGFGKRPVAVTSRQLGADLKPIHSDSWLCPVCSHSRVGGRRPQPFAGSGGGSLSR